MKSNLVEFKSYLRKAFEFNVEPLKVKLNLINEKISSLQTRLESFSGNIDDSYVVLKNEITEEIENLIKDKKNVENAILTHSNNDELRKEIINALENLSDADRDQNYRTLFKKMVVKSRTDLIFIIGAEDLNGINLLDLPKAFQGTYMIKVRAQLYKVNFGIHVLPPQ